MELNCICATAGRENSAGSSINQFFIFQVLFVCTKLKHLRALLHADRGELNNMAGQLNGWAHWRLAMHSCLNA
jgi:hypothetical protein